MTLISRYYERFADHAVSVAHRVIYLRPAPTTPTPRPATRTTRTTSVLPEAMFTMRERDRKLSSVSD